MTARRCDWDGWQGTGDSLDHCWHVTKNKQNEQITSRTQIKTLHQRCVFQQYLILIIRFEMQQPVFFCWKRVCSKTIFQLFCWNKNHCNQPVYPLCSDITSPLQISRLCYPSFHFSAQAQKLLFFLGYEGNWATSGKSSVDRSEKSRKLTQLGDICLQEWAKSLKQELKDFLLVQKVVTSCNPATGAATVKRVQTCCGRWFCLKSERIRRFIFHLLNCWNWEQAWPDAAVTMDAW